jgi:Spy/CpxP family protein refolding chaperone
MTRSLRPAALALATGLALALAWGLAAAAAARPPGGGPRHHGPPPIDRALERHADRLGLDDAARARIRELAEAGRAEQAELRDSLSARHEEMRALLDQDAPDEQAVLGQAERIGELETALQKERLRTMLKIRALLTPAQRAELVTIHQEMRERHRERRGGPHGDRWRSGLEADPEVQGE